MGESEAAQFESRVKRYARTTGLLLVASVTTLFVLRGIVQHWPAFSALQKFTAALLLSGVVMHPVTEIWFEKGVVRDRGRFRATLTWNALLMIAVAIFTTS